MRVEVKTPSSFNSKFSGHAGVQQQPLALSRFQTRPFTQSATEETIPANPPARHSFLAGLAKMALWGLGIGLVAYGAVYLVGKPWGDYLKALPKPKEPQAIPPAISPNAG